MECIVDYGTCAQYHGHINKYINNYVEVSHPQSGSLSPSFLIELECGNVGFWGEGKTGGVPGENLSDQRWELTTNSTHIWRPRWDLNPGQIGGRRVFSPLRHPLLPNQCCTLAVVILAKTFLEFSFLWDTLPTYQKIYCQFIYSFLYVFLNPSLRTPLYCNED